MFVNRCYEKNDNDMVNKQMNMPMGDGCAPVMECPVERVCHREICHDVQHIVPINTRIINHHIYRHSYQPCYTCTYEDEISNVCDNNCQF